MSKETIRLPLDIAIASILGMREMVGYRDIGQNMKVGDLAKLLGLTGTPMLYRYRDGKTLTIEPERALVIFYKFGVLIDLWLDEEQLLRDAENAQLSAEIAHAPIKPIINAIVRLEGTEDCTELRRGLRKLIAKHY